MFRLREAQVAELSVARRNAFYQRASHELRARHPEATSSLRDADLDALTVDGAEEASTFGIVLEADIFRYLECMLLYGRHMATDANCAWIGQTLRRPGLDGTARMNRIAEIELLHGHDA
jgi:hypothetical protein